MLSMTAASLVLFSVCITHIQESLLRNVIQWNRNTTALHATLFDACTLHCDFELHGAVRAGLEKCHVPCREATQHAMRYPSAVLAVMRLLPICILL